jgi:hypothetical protein
MTIQFTLVADVGTHPVRFINRLNKAEEEDCDSF